jgi:N-acetylmuramoyl-L-alanine amidase
MIKKILGSAFWVFLFAIATMPASSYSDGTPSSSLKEEASKKPKAVVILDAGHGGRDEGAKVHSFQEKKLTLLTTLLAKKYLTQMGYKVILTRTKDTYLPLEKRVEFANKTKADLFVSIHFNASSSFDAKGIEVYYHGTGKSAKSKASQNLARSVLYQMVDSTEASSRGVKSGKFLVIRQTEMPSILIEAGFMTNKEERLLLKDRAYVEKIAKGVAMGIDSYIKS